MKNTFSSQDFILTAVRANGDVLRYASGWHCDPEVVLTAIEKVQHQPTTWGCRAGGAVCSWVHVDENLWRLPMLFTMWIPDSGSVWSNLDERNSLSLSGKKCAKRPVRHNYIGNPSSLNAVYILICIKVGYTENQAIFRAPQKNTSTL